MAGPFIRHDAGRCSREILEIAGGVLGDTPTEDDGRPDGGSGTGICSAKDRCEIVAAGIETPDRFAFVVEHAPELVTGEPGTRGKIGGLNGDRVEGCAPDGREARIAAGLRIAVETVDGGRSTPEGFVH